MLRSMYSAVSGLRSHQTMMDVTGNNVSNVNTAGYKSSRTTFQETLTDLVRGGTMGIAGEQGGVNPMQLGLGSQVAATDMVFTQGASQNTGRPTDVAIQGDGFFVVESGGEDYFTRAGAFTVDAGGNLVGPGGEMVQGWVADPPEELDDDTVVAGAGIADNDLDALSSVTIDPEAYTDISIAEDGMVTGRDEDGTLFALAQLATVRFANAGGLERAGNGLYAESPNAGEVVLDTPGQDGLGGLQGGVLEMSNVDLAEEFTNLIMAQRGFQANARSITTSDELLQELVNLKR